MSDDLAPVEGTDYDSVYLLHVDDGEHSGSAWIESDTTMDIKP